MAFKLGDPDSLDDVSRERFEGTVLKAISKDLKKEELGDGGGGRAEGGPTSQVRIATDKTSCSKT